MMKGSSGQIKFPWYCKNCGARTTIYEPKNSRLVFEKVFDVTVDVECERCGAHGAELHHWMPSFIDEDKNATWPVGYLCPRCHLLWHSKVTPRMSEKIV
jgi:hypothetical protein